MTFEFRFVRKLNKVLILFLLSLFFVFHGFVENYDLISVKDAFQLTLFYFLVSGLLLVIFHFLFKALLKAAVFTFCLLAFHFFFGSIHDTLKNLAGDVVITRYSFILVFSFLFFFGLIHLFKTITRLFFSNHSVPGISSVCAYRDRYRDFEFQNNKELIGKSICIAKRTCYVRHLLTT